MKKTLDDIKAAIAARDEQLLVLNTVWAELAKMHAAAEYLAVELYKAQVEIDKLKEQLEKANATLEKIQKNLEDYLETKRMAFPRFYFLSNDELLEILSQTKNVQAVQPHMAKCFDGIRRLDFGKDPKSIDIFGMVSPEGEYVGLGKNLKARGNVEQWLTSVEQSMQVSLKRLAKKAYQDYPESKRTEWIFAQPAQVVLAIAQIYWIRETEQYLAPASSDPAGDLGTWYEKNCSMLTDLTEIVRQDLNKLQRKIAGALITIDVHSHDIIEILINKKAHSISDFDWQMQLRQYWEQKEALVREEQLVLRALSFDTSTGQPPSALLLAYLSVMRAPRPLCELSCALLNDSACQPSLSHLASSPNVLAASVIHLASSLLRTPNVSAMIERLHTYVDDANVHFVCFNRHHHHRCRRRRRRRLLVAAEFAVEARTPRAPW